MNKLEILKNNPEFYTKSKLPWRLIGNDILDNNNNVIVTVEDKIDGEFIIALVNESEN